MVQRGRKCQTLYSMQCALKTHRMQNECCMLSFARFVLLEVPDWLVRSSVEQMASSNDQCVHCDANICCYAKWSSMMMLMVASKQLQVHIKVDIEYYCLFLYVYIMDYCILNTVCQWKHRWLGHVLRNEVLLQETIEGRMKGKKKESTCHCDEWACIISKVSGSNKGQQKIEKVREL